MAFLLWPFFGELPATFKTFMVGKNPRFYECLKRGGGWKSPLFLDQCRWCLLFLPPVFVYSAELSINGKPVIFHHKFVNLFLYQQTTLNWKTSHEYLRSVDHENEKSSVIIIRCRYLKALYIKYKFSTRISQQCPTLGGAFSAPPSSSSAPRPLFLRSLSTVLRKNASKRDTTFVAVS